MIKYKISTLIAFVVGALLLSQKASSQTDACLRVTGKDLGNTTVYSSEGILADAINGERSKNGSFRVFSVRIVCEAYHPIRNRYKYTSALVSFICTMDCNDTAFQTIQLTLECVNNAWSAPRANDTEFVLTTNPIANISTKPAFNCRLCIKPNHPMVDNSSMTVSPVTHCAGCPELSDDNGQFTYSNERLFNGTATLNCNDTYRAVDSPANCTTSGWTRVPFCTNIPTPPSCGVDCIGGAAASVAITVLGVGLIIVLVVVLVRDYRKNYNFHQVTFDVVPKSEDSVSEKSYIQISKVPPPLAPVLKTATSDIDETGDDNL